MFAQEIKAVELGGFGSGRKNPGSFFCLFALDLAGNVWYTFASETAKGSFYSCPKEDTVKNLLRIFIIANFFCLAQLAMAAPIYGTSATMTGSTTLTEVGNWNVNMFTWNIVNNGNGTWNYSYTFSHDGSDLSHLVLEFTQGCGQDPGCITNSTNNPDGPKSWSANSPPNFELAAAIYGVKFDGFGSGSPNTWSFTSNRAPVWGDVYLRDGGNAYAYNAGLINHQSELVADFVARPNGAPDQGVPEPSSFALAGLGIGFLTWRKCMG